MNDLYLRSINVTAQIYETTRSCIDLSFILDRHAYSNNSPPDYILKNIHEQTSTLIPHGHQVYQINHSILSFNNLL
jgi:G3E family GTPase